MPASMRVASNQQKMVYGWNGDYGTTIHFQGDVARLNTYLQAVAMTPDADLRVMLVPGIGVQEDQGPLDANDSPPVRYNWSMHIHRKEQVPNWMLPDGDEPSKHLWYLTVTIFLDQKATIDKLAVPI